MNAHDLSQVMAEHAGMIAEHLFPNGRKVHGEWRVGSLSGEAGQSLSIRLTGHKRGQWKDFATEDGGDLLDAWAKRGMHSIAQAMQEVKSFLGIIDTPKRPPVVTYQRPVKPCCETPARLVKQWLLSRGLTLATVEAYQIGEQVWNHKSYAVFPYLREGVLINTKYRNVQDKKDMRQEKQAEPCLFGWHLIEPTARTIAICEGELDAMTLHQMGIAALSVNAGANNTQWIESDWERLECFSEILLCFDQDAAGQKGSREVANRLGLERCRVVKFDQAKDANAYLQSGAERADFHTCLETARPFDPQELCAWSDF